jgi:hypothetical protein
MRVRRYLIELAKGFALFWGAFFLLSFIAFVPFSRESSAYLILAVWAAILAILVWLLWRQRLVGWMTLGFSLLTFVVTASLFFVPVNDNIPAEARALNRDIAAEHDNRYAYAEALFFALTERWTTPTRQYLLEPHKVLFKRDFAYFWERPGEYVDSNLQAQIYKRLLLDSGRFADEELWLERYHCINSPHTVLAIQGDDRIVHADLWAADHFDDYRFGMFTAVPCTELYGDPL